jgi:hypothetical protein
MTTWGETGTWALLLRLQIARGELRSTVWRPSCPVLAPSAVAGYPPPSSGSSSARASPASQCAVSPGIQAPHVGEAHGQDVPLGAPPGPGPDTARGLRWPARSDPRHAARGRGRTAAPDGASTHVRPLELPSGLLETAGSVEGTPEPGVDARLLIVHVWQVWARRRGGRPVQPRPWGGARAAAGRPRAAPRPLDGVRRQARARGEAIRPPVGGTRAAAVRRPPGGAGAPLGFPPPLLRPCRRRRRPSGAHRPGPAPPPRRPRRRPGRGCTENRASRRLRGGTDVLLRPLLHGA